MIAELGLFDPGDRALDMQIGTRLLRGFGARLRRLQQREEVLGAIVGRQGVIDQARQQQLVFAKRVDDAGLLARSCWCSTSSVK